MIRWIVSKYFNFSAKNYNNIKCKFLNRHLKANNKCVFNEGDEDLKTKGKINLVLVHHELSILVFHKHNSSPLGQIQASISHLLKSSLPCLK